MVINVILHIAALSLCLIFQACSPPATQVASFNGQTMGTTYQVSFPAGGKSPENLKASTDSLLIAINMSMSTYIETSLISMINASTDTAKQHSVDVHFRTVYNKANEVFKVTGGAFNPAVGPLVSAWGFGAEKAQSLSAQQVDSLLKLTDFNAFQWSDNNLSMTKHLVGAKLDFSAIAKGYGVDAVAELMESRKISSYYIEIGGEVRTRGLHPAGRPWRVGIDKPVTNEIQAREIQLAIELQDQALATSGNYRNYYIKEGKKYVHTINPFTGYPEESDLLSASVLARDCMTADAYATAFMVMGREKAFRMAEQTVGIEAYFITSDPSGGYQASWTSGFPPALNRE